jgi:hypothetical protein
VRLFHLDWEDASRPWQIRRSLDSRNPSRDHKTNVSSTQYVLGSYSMYEAQLTSQPRRSGPILGPFVCFRMRTLASRLNRGLQCRPILSRCRTVNFMRGKPFLRDHHASWDSYAHIVRRYAARHGREGRETVGTLHFSSRIFALFLDVGSQVARRRMVREANVSGPSQAVPSVLSRP